MKLQMRLSGLAVQFFFVVTMLVGATNCAAADQAKGTFAFQQERATIVDSVGFWDKATGHVFLCFSNEKLTPPQKAALRELSFSPMGFPKNLPPTRLLIDFTVPKTGKLSPCSIDGLATGRFRFAAGPVNGMQSIKASEFQILQGDLGKSPIITVKLAVAGKQAQFQVDCQTTLQK